MNPDNISKAVLSKGLDAGTAYSILSIDIADVDVGRNIGAHLEADQAEADKKDETVTDCEQDRTKTEQSEEKTENPQSVEDIESSETVEKCKMAVEETPLATVPDVLSALNDPLCGETDSYSSSPVKSESAQSKSSCEWSDLIEQDMKEMQEFQLDSRELTCKLSGLELAGSGRSNDRFVLLCC